MKDFKEITRFKVEDSLLRIVERYRIVKGVHDCDTNHESYWLESWIPNTKKWCLTYRYHRWDTIERLFASPEFKAIMKI